MASRGFSGCVNAQPKIYDSAYAFGCIALWIVVTRNPVRVGFVQLLELGFRFSAVFAASATESKNSAAAKTGRKNLAPEFIASALDAGFV